MRDRVEVGIELGVVAAAEALLLKVLPPERLHDPHARQSLLKCRERLTDAVAHQQIRLVGVAPKPDRGDDHRGHGDEAADGQQR